MNIERIQHELKRREGKDVPIDTIRDVLVKLSRGDLVEYMEFGRWFRKTVERIAFAVVFLLFILILMKCAI